jgi:hypothetical protein
MPKIKAIPDVEIFARPFGYLQWVCPACHEIFGAKQISGRRARIVCTHCAKAFRLGLGFTQAKTYLPPYNAVIAERWNGFTANRLWGAEVSAEPIRFAIARFRGRVDWVCPLCGVSQSQIVGRELMSLRCGVCEADYFLSVIFYPSLPGAPIKCPLDWSLPAYETPETPQLALGAEAAHQSA